MENTQESPKKNNEQDTAQSAGQEEVQFENASVDPGFATEEDTAEEQENDSSATDSNDALNYKNDREHGAYNPKNI